MSVKINRSTPDAAIELNKKINENLNNDPQADVGEIIRGDLSADNGALADSAKNLAKKAMKYAGEQLDNMAQNNVPDNSLPGLTIEWVISRMDRIINETGYIHNAINELAWMKTDGVCGDIGSANKAEAIGNVVKYRETTNQQTLGILEKMYDDLKPQKSGEQDVTPVQIIKRVAEQIKSIDWDGIPADVREAISTGITAQLSRNW